MKTSSSDFQTLYARLTRYCSYQDRCKRDVEMKLQGWKVSKGLIERVIMELAKEGYVDDLRFARSFVRGKFRGNKWGKQRIVFALKARKIDEQHIKEALEEIDEASYMDSIRSLIRKKDLEIKLGKTLNKREKIINFVVGKGYEIGLVLRMMNEQKK